MDFRSFACPPDVSNAVLHVLCITGRAGTVIGCVVPHGLQQRRIEPSVPFRREGVGVQIAPAKTAVRRHDLPCGFFCRFPDDVRRKLSELFRSVGLKKENEKIKMNWSALPGLTGRAQIGLQPGTKDPDKKFNCIKKLYPKEPKKFEPGRF